MRQRPKRNGLWLVGACGGVGATVAIGIEAIRRRLAEPIGLLGHLPPFDRLGLTPLDDWVLGGHEVRRLTFEQAAQELQTQSRLFDDRLIAACRPWLRACDRNIRTGTVAGCGRTIERMADLAPSRRRLAAAKWITILADDIRDFARRHRLGRVVVVNIASTEPPLRTGRVHRNWESLSRSLRNEASPLPASSLYALAAIESGAAYINFTPSAGIGVPGLLEHAQDRGAAFMGCDGKTGETLMKSVLAPMFAARNLPVLSWVGHNIFGNRDALVLDDPRNKAAKTRSKDHLVADILGYAPKTLVSIERIDSLGDWKTAWDHIHFAGFMGIKMSLQFTWQGCDSILAAPLVIELARFAEYAARVGESGPLRHLACFFKSPMGVGEQGFARQYEMLIRYAAAHTAK